VRRLSTLLALAAALALPLVAPAPASAGDNEVVCPEGTTGNITIDEIRQRNVPWGVVRHAIAADDNHNGVVCFVQHHRLAHFKDDIVE
jgi:hypothetical protein